MNARTLFPIACLLLAVVQPSAAQDMVEHSLGTAGSGTAATRSRAVGKSVGSVFRKLNAATERSATANSQVVNPPRAHVGDRKAASASSSEDSSAEAIDLISACAESPDAISIGTTYDDLLAKCGTPALKTSGPDGGEVLYFSGKSGEVAVIMESGKVKSVKPPKASKESNAAAVVILK